MDAKRGFHLRQLAVRLPQLFSAAVRYFGAKQIAARTHRRPVASRFNVLLPHASSAVCRFLNSHLEQLGRSRILVQHATDLAFQFHCVHWPSGLIAATLIR